MKEIEWLGNTRKEIRDFPDPVKKEIGHVLHLEQMEIPHSSIKLLKGYSHSVREIKCSFKKNAYRCVYVVNLGDKIYSSRFSEKVENGNIHVKT